MIWLHGYLVLCRPVCKIQTLPELRNYLMSFRLEIFISYRYWPPKTACKISAKQPARLVFYRLVSILPKILTFCITTCPILMVLDDILAKKWKWKKLEERFQNFQKMMTSSGAMTSSIKPKFSPEMPIHICAHWKNFILIR